jgi:hypothetical protein
MSMHDEERPARSSEEKSPWERPTIRPVGTIALLVRGGSAQGKPGGDFDGDMNQFQAHRE